VDVSEMSGIIGQMKTHTQPDYALSSSQNLLSKPAASKFTTNAAEENGTDLFHCMNYLIIEKKLVE